MPSLIFSLSRYGIVASHPANGVGKTERGKLSCFQSGPGSSLGNMGGVKGAVEFRDPDH
jgi:hypothetical protein